MSFAALLSRTATISGRSQTGPPDEYNMPTWVATSSTASCYLEQTERREVTVGRETQLATHLVIFPSGTVLDGSDLVTIDGTTYEVLGPPWSVDQPGSGEHHIEANLRELTG